MKTILLSFVALFFCVGLVSAQRDKPILGQNGQQIRVDKGWEFLTYVGDKNDKAKYLYSYQTSSVIKIGPNSFKYWGKEKSYEINPVINYSLVLNEVRCRTRESRITRIIEYKANDTMMNDVVYPDAVFKDVVPESNGLEILLIVCKAFDK